MTETLNDQEELELRAIFGRAIEPVADQGFSMNVLGRIRRKIWQRRLVLMSTIAIGLVIALPTVPQLLTTLSGELVALVTHAEESDAFGKIQAVLTLLPLRETVQAASTEMAQVGAEMGAVSWFAHLPMYILAGLMALLGLLGARLLER